MKLFILLLLIYALGWMLGGMSIENFTPISTIKQKFHNIRYKRCDTTLLPKVEQNVADKFQKVKDESWNLYLPCGYTYVEKELKDNSAIFSKKPSGWVLGISGCDELAAKDRLWNHLLKRYGEQHASVFMPTSWVTYDQEQMARFYKFAERNPGTLYIAKGNRQQQTSLYLFTEPLEAQNLFQKDYVVIQKVLTDPYLIDERKINLRIYVLVVCTGGKKTLYAYDDGFVYYTKVPYGNGKKRDEVITSGYIDRSVYEKNPLTVKDFMAHISAKHGHNMAQKFIEMRNYVLSGVMEAVKDSLCVPDSSAKNNLIHAQTFGIDMQPNFDLTDLKLLELNKGQELTVHDARDGLLKQKMIDDVYRVLGAVNDGENVGFKKVWEEQ
jgi:hypothetical protein